MFSQLLFPENTQRQLMFSGQGCGGLDQRIGCDFSRNFIDQVAAEHHAAVDYFPFADLCSRQKRFIRTKQIETLHGFVLFSQITIEAVVIQMQKIDQVKQKFAGNTSFGADIQQCPADAFSRS